MDEVVANALRRREELKAELDEIETFMRLHAKFSTAARTSPVHPNVVVRSPSNEATSSATIIELKRASPAEFADLAEMIIRREGRALSRTELVELIEADKFEIPSQDKSRYLGTILWRNRDRFINSGRGYALADMITAAELAEARRQEKLDVEIDGSVEPSRTGQLRYIAQNLARLLPREHTLRARSSITAGAGIPTDISAKLLTSARAKLNRDLDEPERIILREEFGNALD